MSPAGKIAREWLKFEPMEITGSIWEKAFTFQAVVENVLQGTPRKIQIMIYIDSSGSMELKQPDLLLYCDRLIKFIRANSSATLEVGIGRFEDGKAEALLPPTLADDAGLAKITEAVISISFGAGQGRETAGDAFVNGRTTLSSSVVAELALPSSVGEPLCGLPNLGRGWNPSPTDNGDVRRSVIILSDDEADYGDKDKIDAIETEEGGIQTLYIDDLKKAMPAPATGARQTGLSLFTELKGQLANYLGHGGSEEDLKKWGRNSQIFLSRLAAASALAPDEDILATIEKVRMDPGFHELLKKRRGDLQAVFPFGCDPRKERCEFSITSFFLYLDIWRQLGTSELQEKAAIDTILYGIYDSDRRPTPVNLRDSEEYVLRTLNIEPSILVKTIFTLGPDYFSMYRGGQENPYENGSDFIRTILPNPDAITVNDITSRILAMFDNKYGNAIYWWLFFRHVPQIRDSEIILGKILSTAEAALAEGRHNYVINEVFRYRLFDEATRERIFLAAVESNLLIHSTLWKDALSPQFLKGLAVYGFVEKESHWLNGWWAFGNLTDEEKLEVARAVLDNKRLSEDSRKYIEAHLLVIQKRYTDALLLSNDIVTRIRRSSQYITKGGLPGMTIDSRQSNILGIFEEFYNKTMGGLSAEEHATVLNELALRTLGKNERNVFQSIADSLMNADMELFCQTIERLFSQPEVLERTKLWLLIVVADRAEKDGIDLPWHVNEDPKEEEEYAKRQQKYFLDRAMEKREEYDNWWLERRYQAKLISELLVKIASDRNLSDEIRTRAIYSLQVGDRPSGFKYSKGALEAAAGDLNDPLHETIVSTLKVMEEARPEFMRPYKDTSPPNGQ